VNKLIGTIKKELCSKHILQPNLANLRVVPGGELVGFSFGLDEDDDLLTRVVSDVVLNVKNINFNINQLKI
jgi:hypothetical protein